jgi:hypothetical protein
MCDLQRNFGKSIWKNLLEARLPKKMLFKTKERKCYVGKI